MRNPASDWSHTTVENFLTHPSEVAGIDLFDDVFEGRSCTAIYQRFKDGGRWPARTVTPSPSNPNYVPTIVAAWASKGPVHDFREATVGKPWSGMTIHVPKANVQAVVEAIKKNRAAIEREYVAQEMPPGRDGYIAIVAIIARPRSVVVHAAHTRGWKDISINVLSDAIAKFVPADLKAAFPSWG